MAKTEPGGLPRLLTVQDVCRVLGCCEDIAYEVMHSVHGGPIRLGRSLRITESDLATYCEKQRKKE